MTEFGLLRYDIAPETIVDADEMAPADAAFVTSWHPAVALAVADWLEGAAGTWEQDASLPLSGAEKLAESRGRQALTVARAYLGRES